MRLLFDSSVFISFLNEKDIFHKETVKFIEILSEENDIVIVVPVTVFLETVNILYKMNIDYKDQQFFEIFKRYQTVDLTFESSYSIISFFKKLNLKTNDAIIATISKITASTLITWDQKLKKEASNLVEVYTPEEVLKKL